jgi:hypothetical protein
MKAALQVWVILASLGAQPALAGDCLMFDAFALRVESSDVDMVAMDGGLTLIFNSKGRAPSRIAFASTDHLDDTGMSEVAVLPNGLTLHYLTEVDEAMGSGGADARLRGWVNSLPPLSVTCSAQDETPDAAWCVPVLGGLRPKADGC